MFQLRRKEARAGARDPFYNPERDIAHLGPNLLRGAMVSCEETYWEPWLKQFMLEQGISYQTIVDTNAPVILARAFNRIVRAENPKVALEAEGFHELPSAIQMLFYTRIGQVCLAMIWAGVKDVSKPDDAPPATVVSLLTDVEDGFKTFLEGSDEDEDAADGSTPDPSQSQ